MIVVSNFSKKNKEAQDKENSKLFAYYIMPKYESSLLKYFEGPNKPDIY